MTAGEKWYAVRLVVEITVGDGQDAEAEKFEDRIVVVRSTSSGAAQTKAERLARDDNFEYPNVDGVMVFWRFRGTVDVQELSEQRDHIGDGSEVYSAFVDAEVLRILENPQKSPLEEYLSAHPEADIESLTAGEVVEYADNRDSS